MKILHIATGFQLSYSGGITNYVRTLVKSQLRLDHQVHVLARPDTEISQQIHGIRLHPYTPARVAPFSLRNYLKDPAEDLIRSVIGREKFDIVHFHMALDLSSGFLEQFSDLQVPYVVSLHDYFYVCPRITMVDAHSNVCREVKLEKCKVCIGKLDQINLLKRAADKFNIRLPRIPSRVVEQRMAAMHRFLANSSMLFSVSTRTAEIYGAAVPEARIVVEQIGSESVNGQHRKIYSDKIRVVALNALSKHKGADLLHMFLTQVKRPDMEFHFYGRTVAGYGQKLSRLGLQCHGPYKPTDISDIMSKSDIGLVLSIWEDNGPQVAMEFINHKVPVLGTSRGGIPDIVSPNAGHLFDPDQTEEREGAVRWLQEITCEQIERISRSILRLKTPDEHMQRILALYKEALGGNSAAMMRIND